MAKQTEMHDCDHGHKTTSQTRRLPADAGNATATVVCWSHYQQNMAWRKEKNKRLKGRAKFPIPAWRTLQIVEE